ncbi:protein tic 22-like [Quercus suber]|uniref:Protein tic 22-like n=1 Tax=Quercus suber TaxID=58331 RepID=A0AAW0LW50_QUESU
MATLGSATEQNQVSTGDNTGKSTSGQRTYMATLEGEQQNSGHRNKRGKMSRSLILKSQNKSYRPAFFRKESSTSKWDDIVFIPPGFDVSTDPSQS